MLSAAEELDEQDFIQEALDNFAVLIDDVDLEPLLEPMHIGRMQFLMRKQMLIELRGLFIALWRLALGRSFPNVADTMFIMFLKHYGQTHSGKASSMVVERAQEYWGMIQPVGDSDFHDIARHLTSFIVKDQKDTKPLVLKLALRIRSAYCFIFERLI